MAEKRLSGSKILMVIAPKEFRDEELLTPKKLLSEAGASVIVASTTADEAKGMLGAKIKPDIVLSSALASDYDCVIVVGGMGSPEFLWNNAQLHSLIQEMDREEKVVAAICLSGRGASECRNLAKQARDCLFDTRVIAVVERWESAVRQRARSSRRTNNYRGRTAGGAEIRRIYNCRTEQS